MIAEVGKRYPDEHGRTATVTAVKPVHGLGLCAFADVEPSKRGRGDTRTHIYAGRLVDFGRHWRRHEANGIRGDDE